MVKGQNRFPFKRIYIFGATGSGKTTLAKKLSSIMSIPFYTTDKIIYRRHYDLKYSEATRNKTLLKISNGKRWIIEGVHAGDWILPAFKRSDFVIILSHPRPVLLKRAVTRYLERKSLNPHRDSLKDLILLLKYAYIYRDDKFITHQKLIGEHKKKFILLEGQKQIDQFMQNIHKQKREDK